MSEPRVITIFRSRLRGEARAAYDEVAARMSERAATMPGYVEHTTYESSDGGRVTVVIFENWASHYGWRDDPEHRAAMARGRGEFYASYELIVAEEVRDERFGTE